MEQVKSWCLNNLQIPLNTNNRVSPCNTTKRISFSPSIQSNSSTIISNYLKKQLKKSQSFLSNQNNATWLPIRKKGQQLLGDEGVKIYLKSPHVVANGDLAGTLVIDQKNVYGIELFLIGTEVVNDIHYPFLNTLILNLNFDQIQSCESDDKLVVPFTTTLPPQLTGSFTDKKCCIQYELQGHIKLKEQLLFTRKSVLVYPNVASLKSKDAIDLYVPILLDNKQVWKSVNMDISLSRMVWMSGAPIYITVKINNATRHRICDMKLQLLRKQTILEHVSCDIVSHSSLSKSGWWQPIEPNAKDNLTMTIHAPLNQVTIRNQKLIDISFSIQMLICSPEKSDIIAEIPVILVHPIAMDPPPSTKEPNVFSLRPPLSKNIDLSASSLTSILSITQPIPTSPYSHTSKKALQKMKKSISSWGTMLSRKMSLTHIGALTSPRMISSYATSNSSVTTYSTLQDEEEDELRSSIEQRSMMKFGHMKGPKRFGQQPGCLGDAGLDIRNCFNVSKATEVIQSYAAEKVELGNSPNSFLETNFKLKEGLVAPSEKCQVDISMIQTQ